MGLLFFIQENMGTCFIHILSMWHQVSIATKYPMVKVRWCLISWC